MSERAFRLRHFGHTIVHYNSSRGGGLLCNKCDVCNITPDKKAGAAENFEKFEDWKVFHEKHGMVANAGGGTTHEFFCQSCGSGWPS